MLNCQYEENLHGRKLFEVDKNSKLEYEILQLQNVTEMCKIGNFEIKHWNSSSEILDSQESLASTTAEQFKLGDPTRAV